MSVNYEYFSIHGVSPNADNSSCVRIPFLRTFQLLPYATLTDITFELESLRVNLQSLGRNLHDSSRKFQSLLSLCRCCMFGGRFGLG